MDARTFAAGFCAIGVPKSVSHRPRSENGCSVVLIELPDPSEAV